MSKGDREAALKALELRLLKVYENDDRNDTEDINP